MPVIGTPSTWPVSSKDTSAVGGSTESTRLTSLLPLVSLICWPIIDGVPLSCDLELRGRGEGAIVILEVAWMLVFGSKICCMRQIVLVLLIAAVGRVAWGQAA